MLDWICGETFFY